MVVESRQNLLTIIADNVPLGTILANISSKTAISIEIQGSAETPISVRISNRPVEEAIRRLVRGRSYVFIYPPNEAGQRFSKPMSVFIYSESSNFDLIPGETIVASSEATSEISVPDLAESDGAFERLKEQAFEGDQGALSQIIDLSLYDEKEETRALAIETLGNIGEELVMDVLIRALDDDQAWVRAASVRAIGQHGGGRALHALTYALKDPVPEVRETARFVLDDMEGE
jgi:hypothetical protein